MGNNNQTRNLNSNSSDRNSIQNTNTNSKQLQSYIKGGVKFNNFNNN